MRQRHKNSLSGFSFVEVILALAVVASALITLVALIPVGQKAARRAAFQTIAGHIVEDAHERLEGHPLADGVLESGPFFYDSDGVFVGPDSAPGRLAQRIYRVDVRLGKPHGEALEKTAPDLKAVIMTLSWPVNPATGDRPVLGTSNEETISYYVSSLSGANWKAIDPEFEPAIEF